MKIHQENIQFCTYNELCYYATKKKRREWNWNKRDGLKMVQHNEWCENLSNNWFQQLLIQFLWLFQLSLLLYLMTISKLSKKYHVHLFFRCAFTNNTVQFEGTCSIIISSISDWIRRKIVIDKWKSAEMLYEMKACNKESKLNGQIEFVWMRPCLKNTSQWNYRWWWNFSMT